VEASGALEHYLRIGGEVVPISGDPQTDALRDQVEPWLSAILQSEHLALLVGSGFTIGVGALGGVSAPGMSAAPLSGEHAEAVGRAADRVASRVGRAEANVEDQINAALALAAGLDVLGDDQAQEWHTHVNALLSSLTHNILQGERDIRSAASGESGSELRAALVSFLLSFAGRATSRERLHLFTTNYDRLVEWACDLAGLRPLDRFVGGLEPVFRASRLDVDLHYNPPGIRGEPRYLEGVLRFSKLHGSLDWRWENGSLRRVALPFGAGDDHPGLPADPSDALMIYPNPAKDVETLAYPYAELFRDLSAALCRPNTALITYGYGFGDEHINRVIADMLSIPSTHLVAISYDWAGGRIQKWLDETGHESQVSLMIGPHLGDLQTLVAHYLPRPSLGEVSVRRADLLRRRDEHSSAAT
jgi:hypothetical protein